MVETITPVVHGGRTRRWALALALHVVGAGIAAAAFGAVLGAAGMALGAPWGAAGFVAIGALGVLYLTREAFGVRVPVPQLRRQVPDWWRTFFGFETAALLYGMGLGIGFVGRLARRARNGTDRGDRCSRVRDPARRRAGRPRWCCRGDSSDRVRVGRRDQGRARSSVETVASVVRVRRRVRAHVGGWRPAGGARDRGPPVPRPAVDRRSPLSGNSRVVLGGDRRCPDPERTAARLRMLRGGESSGLQAPVGAERRAGDRRACCVASRYGQVDRGRRRRSLWGRARSGRARRARPRACHVGRRRHRSHGSARNGVMRRLLVGVTIAAAALALALPAVANHTSPQDGNDTEGLLDLRTVSLGHERPLVWTFFTIARWRPRQIYDRGYFVVELDTRGDQSIDYVVLLRSRRQEMLGTLHRVLADGTQAEIAKLPSDKFGGRLG